MSANIPSDINFTDLVSGLVSWYSSGIITGIQAFSSLETRDLPALVVSFISVSLSEVVNITLGSSIKSNDHKKIK